MATSEKTSKNIASKASDVLRSSNASKTAKSLAGSALSQSGSSKSTSAAVAKTASKALDSGSTSRSTKSLAGSVLTQKTKK